MEQDKLLRLMTKRSDRVAGWLFLPFVGLLWLFVFGLAILFLSGLLANFHRIPPGENLLFILAIGLVLSLAGFLAFLMTVKLHNALASYEFTPYGVVKRSPFWRQEAKWSQVAGWALVESDNAWWLLDANGRSWLSLDWYLLPPKEVSAAKRFVSDNLQRFLPSALWLQPSIWQRWRLLGMVAAALMLLGWLGWYWNKQVNELAALAASLAVLWGTLRGAVLTFSAPGRAMFIVHGDWLTEPSSGISVHLPTVQQVSPRAEGAYLVGDNGQMLFVPRRLSSLWDYLRIRLPFISQD